MTAVEHLQEVRDAQVALERLEHKVRRARKHRDRLVQEALTAGATQSQLARAMGLTRQGAWKISKAKVRL